MAKVGNKCEKQLERVFSFNLTFLKQVSFESYGSTFNP